MKKDIGRTAKLVYAGLFLAIGLVLPQAFHFLPIGANAGKMFLPMHIPVLLAGFIAGPLVGCAVGLLSPILSSLIFQMPSPVILPAMAMELLTYGLVSGILGKKTKNNFLALIITLVCGRIVNGIMYMVLINLAGLKMLSMEMFFATITMGIPGIIIQLILIPTLVRRVRVYNGEF